MRVLIIDDDEQMRLLLRQIMEWRGYDVLEAENGKVGLKVQRDTPADLIVTDLIMPEQEGLETIRVIKSEFDGVKIIAISGGGRIGPDAYLPAARELGADKVFSKPFDIGELVTAIEELFPA